MITIITEILIEKSNGVNKSVRKYLDPIDAMLGLARELGFSIDFTPLPKTITEQKDK